MKSALSIASLTSGCEREQEHQNVETRDRATETPRPQAYGSVGTRTIAGTSYAVAAVAVFVLLLS